MKLDFIIMVLVTIALLGGTVWFVIAASEAHARDRSAWIGACVADGNKRYVCEERYDSANKSDDVIMMPVVVPVGR